MTHELSKERLEKIAAWRETYGAGHNVMLPAEEAEAMARALLAGMEQAPVATLDVQSGREEGKTFALAYSSAAHKLPDDVYFLYTHPATSITAEEQRVIQMLLNVCGAAFELADDSCQQEVDGESCHVIPDASFVKLSDALDEIENSLPTEDIDRPDVFLSWAAMPRAALKSLLNPTPSIPAAAEPVAVVELSDYVTAAQLSGDKPRKKAVKELYEGALVVGQNLYTHAAPIPAAVPDGYVLMPLKLTAENGAKYALSGEFHVLHRVTCHECGGEGCSDCDDDGWLEEKIMIGWDDIKDIYHAAVEACSIKSAVEGV